jgi:hypothetical protein
LQSHKQLRNVPLSPYPLPHVWLPEFLILAILICLKWNLRVVLICISLITNDFEYFFRCFSAICESSVMNPQISSIPNFLIGLFDFWWLASWVLYIFWILVVFQMWGLGKIFFPICRLLICLIDYVLCLTKALQFHEDPVINSWS